MSESHRGFITAPTLEQLQPTEREKNLLKVLWDWQEQSKHSQLVLGKPTQDKPKCEECGKPLVGDRQVKTGCCAECLQVLLDLLPD